MVEVLVALGGMCLVLGMTMKKDGSILQMEH